MNPTGRPSFSRIYDRLNSFTYRQWKDHVTARNFDSQSLVTEQSKVFISLFLFVMVRNFLKIFILIRFDSCLLAQ